MDTVIFEERMKGCGSSNPRNLKFFDNFENMGIRRPVLQGIRAYRLEAPSLVQGTCIPAIVASEGKYDTIIQSPNGTGKTVGMN